jgi:hypothetical protein
MMNQQVTASLSIAALLCFGTVSDVTGSDFSYAEVDVGAFDFEEISHSSSGSVAPWTSFEPVSDDLDEVSYEAFARLAARGARYEIIEDLPESWNTMRPRFDGIYLRDMIDEEEGED